MPEERNDIKSNRLYYSLFALIIILAGILRFWNIGYHLPLDAHMDELTVLGALLKTAKTGLPQFYNYPSLYIYLSFFFTSIVWLFGKIFLGFPGWADFWNSTLIDSTIPITIMRCLSATFGIAIVGVVMLIIERLRDRIAALTAGFLTAFAFLLVYNVHQARTDTAMSAMVCLSALFAIEVFRSGDSRFYTLSGIFAGLAASMKYNGGLVLLAGVLAHILRMKGEGESWKAIWKHKQARWMVRLAIIAFIATTPGTIFETVNFLKGFGKEMIHMGKGHFGYETVGNGFIFNLSTNWPIAVGLPILFTAIAGLIVLIASKRNRKAGAVFLTFPVIFFLMMGGGNVLFMRYLVPLVPFVTALSAVGLRFISRLSRVKAITIAVLIILSAVAVFPTAVGSIRWLHLAGKPPTMALVRDYIFENIPPDEVFASHGRIHGIYGTREYFSTVDDYSFRGDYRELLLEIAPEKRFRYGYLLLGRNDAPGVASLRKLGVDYYIFNRNHYGRYELAREKFPLQYQAIVEILYKGDVIYEVDGIDMDMEWDLDLGTLMISERLGPTMKIIKLPENIFGYMTP